jgi:iron complex transport system substrate-binding protein
MAAHEEGGFMNRISIFFALGALLMLLPCLLFAMGGREPVANPESHVDTADGTDAFPQKVEPRYSSLFDVEYHSNYKILTVSQPWPGAESSITYVLVQRGTQPPNDVEADRVIEIPIRSIVALSTSYLPHLEMLGVLDTLVGNDAFAWVSSQSVLDRISSGAMKEVGSGSTVNLELLVEMDPDLIMTSAMGNEWDSHPKLEEARLPYVINAEWNERTPLARAEWIKFMAVFYNKEGEANAVFDSIEKEYAELVELASSASEKPTVFTGAPYQGTWWVSGGGSFAARFLADAGGAYIWAEDESTGSLMLDVETVYEKAGKADIWLNTGYWNSLKDAKEADERFTQFAAYETASIYNNNLRMGPGGGNNYFESGPANPHKVLADLIKIFHPELLPEHELYYYKKLE